MKLKEAKINSAAAAVGVWIDGIPEMGDVRLKVRSIGNPDYRRMLSRLVEATPRQFKKAGRVVDMDKLDELTATCLAETVLVDWEGIEDDAGKAMKFDKAHAKTILADPDYRPFRDAVVWAATVAGEETDEAKADASGN